MITPFVRNWTVALIWSFFLSCLVAAPIAWEVPFDITSDSDIDASGTLVEARNATSDGNTQTVIIDGESIVFEAMGFGIGEAAGTFFTGDGGDTGNEALNAVLNSHVWTGDTWSFTLSALSSGTDYQIQLIGGGDTRGCCSARNQRAGDGESPESVSGDYSRSGVGSVIGRFTAGGTTQTIRILNGNDNGVDPSMSGYILREVAPLQSLAPTDMILSNTDLAPDTAVGTLIGLFSSVDPNADDTHTYSLIDSVAFPDNDSFNLVNGNQLRAVTALGGFGTTYSIRLRTTDSASLSYDETFTLAVEAAQAPSVLSFSSTTVVPTTPIGGGLGTFSAVDGNSEDAHVYALVAGVGDTDNALFSIDGSNLKVVATLPALGTSLSFRVRATDLSGLSVEQVVTLAVVRSSIRINEFLADNTMATLPDEDGETPDWIELYNPDEGSVSLGGWYLTDDPTNLTKWQFPVVSIGGNGYLLVFASSRDRRPSNGGRLHTNFSLNGKGDYLALVGADGVSILSAFGSSETDYPKQRAGNSYGFFGNDLQIGFILSPTPNGTNDDNSGVLGFVADTKFGFGRGFYDAPFSLAITTATPGATIRYTTNGDWPSVTSGTVYTGLITVDRTMAVKAIAYRSGYVSTNTDTHTYVLVDSVAAQNSVNTGSVYGLPASWGGQAPYYGMDGNANVSPLTHLTLKDDLKEVPSLSIAMDVDDMFGGQGIYSNPGSSGERWERKTSLELIDSDPDGAGNFQQNCAIRIQGGAFRGFGLTRKKSFRVLFKTQFGTSSKPTGGDGSLKYPLFGTEPGVAREFQTLTFRMESNDGWQWSGAGGQPQYARDEFGRRAQLALGQPAPHGRFMHVYINGVYWGLYNVVERPDASFAESYVEGAEREQWEGQNSGSAINSASNLSTWNAFKSAVAPISMATSEDQSDARYLQACGFNSNGTRNSGLPIWCDPNNNIDYFLVNWYAGNSDWPFKNYYGGIDKQVATRTGYKYFMWDAEWSLLLRSDTNTNKVSDFRGIAEANDDLEESPEYRLRFADRAHRAMFNRGPLSPRGARALYEEVTAQHTSILVPEAARWGGQHGQNRHVADWQSEYDRIIHDWFPVRTGNFLAQLRSRGLYPIIGAPTYSQHGGAMPLGSGPSLIVPQSVTGVYYMFGMYDTDLTDYEHSLDPRLVGGGINPDATQVTLAGDGDGGPSTTRYLESGATWKFLDNGSNQGTAWRAAGFDDGAWSSGPSQLGYGDNDEATELNFVDVGAADGVQKNATTYFRKMVTIADPLVFEDFSLTYVFDDGITIYVNGVEVVRRNLPNNAAYNAYATGSDGDNASVVAKLSPTVFVAGVNTIAAEVHQNGEGSSDMSFDLELTGNPPGGGDSHTSEPIALSEPGWLFSRSYNQSSGEWSALNAAYFSIGTVPADASNLVISELNYHPSEPSTAAELAVSTDRDDYEFIELLNTSGQRIDLTGVRFAGGITFHFVDNAIIPAGGRLVLVKNRTAFETRYAADLGTIVVATDVLGKSDYSGRLNNDGEQLLLIDANGVVIRDFVYNNQLPWPTFADGQGFSLVLTSGVSPDLDHAAASSWVVASQPGGSPGADDEDIVDPVDRVVVTTWVEGAGRVEIVPSTPDHAIGATVIATAIAAEGSVFARWVRDVESTDNPLSFQITGDVAIEAIFVKNYALTIAQPESGGLITVDPSKPAYLEGDSVTLTFVPEEHYLFDGWSGDASGTDVTTSVIMNGDRSVGANLVRAYAVSVAEDLLGGTILVSPDQLRYRESTEVTFTAVADLGYRFVEWGMDLSGASLSLSTQVIGDLQVTAVFEKERTLFEAWKAEQFTDEELEDVAVSGPLADVDRDGVVNFIEYVQGTDPRLGGEIGVIAIGYVDASTLQILVPYLIDDPSVVWIVEQSVGLDQWSTVGAEASELVDGQLRVTLPVLPLGSFVRLRLRLRLD